MKTSDYYRNVTGADFVVHNEGSLFLVYPQTTEARQHLAAGVDVEAQWFGGALVVEPRYVADLVAQLTAEGFAVR